MSASTAPQAKRALLDLLDTRPPLDGVVKRWAGPTREDQVEHDMLWLGKVEFEQEWGSLGSKAASIKPRRKEDYTIKLVVLVVRTGDDAEATEAACWDHVAEIENALRDDPSLGDLLAEWAEVKRGEMETLPASTRGWMAETTLDVHCVARF